MAYDTATPVAASDCEVMASVDSDEEGERLIIAELCRDDAWLAISAADAIEVTEWQ